MNKQSYYAVIPANVRYDTTVPDGAKLLYGEITALADKEGFCWATNAYFAALYGASNRTVCRWLSALAQAGHIAYIVDNSAGSSRKIWLAQHVISAMKKASDPHDKNVVPHTTKMSYPPRQKCRTPHDKNVVPQVKELNNTVEIVVVEESARKNSETKPQKNTPPNSAQPPLSRFDISAEKTELESDPFAMEQFRRDGGAPSEFLTTVDDFITHIRSEFGPEPQYPNRREFRSHFFNWFRRRKEAATRTSAAGSPTTPPRRQNRATVNRWDNNRPALNEPQQF